MPRARSLFLVMLAFLLLVPFTSAERVVILPSVGLPSQPRFCEIEAQSSSCGVVETVTDCRGLTVVAAEAVSLDPDGAPLPRDWMLATVVRTDSGFFFKTDLANFTSHPTFLGVVSHDGPVWYAVTALHVSPPTEGAWVPVTDSWANTC